MTRAWLWLRGGFRCGICQAEFDTIEDLRAHQREGHLR